MFVQANSVLNNFNVFTPPKTIEDYCSAFTIESLDIYGEFGSIYGNAPNGTGCHMTAAEDFFQSDEFKNNANLREIVLERYAENGQLP